MRVTGIRFQAFEHRLDRLIGGASAPKGYDSWAGVVLSVDTDEGITGEWVTSPQLVPIVRSFASDIIGEDPRSVRGLWQRMTSRAFKLGLVGYAALAISALDVALWDLKAKANDEPLWRTLGASRPKVRACYTPIDLPLSDDELRQLYRGAAAQGITAGQLKVGIDQDRDLGRLEIVREELSAAGRRPTLGIDSNEHWSPKQAIRKISEFEQSFDLTWVEEPARRWDYRGLRQVSQSVKAAVASGENITAIGEYMALIDHHAVDLVQISSSTCGITGALQVADLAYGFELPIMMLPSPGMALAHVAACIPNMTYMDVFDGGSDRVFTSDAHVEDGWIVVGDQPGLGLSTDQRAFEQFGVDIGKVSAAGPSPYGRGWTGAGFYDEPLSP